MAWNETIHCMQCKRDRSVVRGHESLSSMICDACKQENADKDKKAHLDELKLLTVSERLAKIEELLYDAPWQTMMRMHNARF